MHFCDAGESVAEYIASLQQVDVGVVGGVQSACTKSVTETLRGWCDTVQYNNGIYRALFTKRPGALTQVAVICSAK